MYCPICGWKNGEFTARCQSCGELLPARIVPPPPVPPSRRRALMIGLATTSLLSSVLLLALAAAITRQDLWPRIIAGPEEVVALPTATPEPGMQRVVATFAASGPARPGRHATIDLGEVTTTGPWKFVVDQVGFVRDDSGSGWYPAIVTCSIQNAGTVSAKLLVPSTVASTLPEPRPTQTLPSFLPAPAASDQAPALAGGLRLYLVDQGNRQFGG